MLLVAHENLTMSKNWGFRIISLIVNADEPEFIIMRASSDQVAKGMDRYEFLKTKSSQTR